MRNYTVYILLCSDQTYYTGVTNDVENRFYEHQTGLHRNSYTYLRRPLKLVFEEHFHDINQAIAFEKQVKGWSKKKKEAIISDNWEKLKELSLCRNDTHHENKA